MSEFMRCYSEVIRPCSIDNPSFVIIEMCITEWREEGMGKDTSCRTNRLNLYITQNGQVSNETMF